jgi:hypothetical protein
MTIIAIAFNTGRQYTQEGQRIIAKVLELQIVGDVPTYRFAFADLDRGIYGRAICFGKFDQAGIMFAYDHGKYEGTWSDADFADAARDYRELTAQAAAR